MSVSEDNCTKCQKPSAPNRQPEMAGKTPAHTLRVLTSCIAFLGRSNGQWFRQLPIGTEHQLGARTSSTPLTHLSPARWVFFSRIP